MDKEESGLVRWAGARLQEKTTYAGLAVLLGIVFHNVPLVRDHVADWVNVVTLFGMGLGALCMIVWKEHPAK